MDHHDEYEYNYDNLVPEWNYEEFSHLSRISEPKTKYAHGYVLDDGEFYIEPWFYTQLTRLLERFPNEKDHILETFFTIAREGKKVVFTRDINDPSVVSSEYLYVEIGEIIIKANVHIDDISRGSDYGD